jgi:hypothetical protein
LVTQDYGQAPDYETAHAASLAAAKPRSSNSELQMLQGLGKDTKKCRLQEIGMGEFSKGRKDIADGAAGIPQWSS